MVTFKYAPFDVEYDKQHNKRAFDVKHVVEQNCCLSEHFCCYFGFVDAETTFHQTPRDCNK